MMQWLANLFADPLTVWVLVAILGLIAVVALGIFAREYAAVLRPLRRATAFLEGLPNAAEVRTHLAAIFAPHRGLRGQWGSFAAASVELEDGEVGSLHPAEEFFNAGALLRGRRLALCRAVPNYLVGLGLVFTFLGIAVVIFRASLALGPSNDPDALRELLRAASVKFWTSLTGVLLSIICAATFRHFTADCQARANELCLALATVIRPLNEGYFLHHLLRQQRTQTLRSEELVQALMAHTQETNETTVRELRTLRTSVSSAISDSLREITRTAAQVVRATLQEALQETAETFGEIHADLERTRRDLQASAELLAGLREETAAMSAETLKRLRDGTKALQKDLEQAASAGERIRESFAEMKEDAEAVQAAFAESKPLVEGLNDFSTELPQLHELAASLSQASQSLTAASAAARKAVEGAAGRLEALNAQAGRTIAEAPAVFARYGEAMSNYTAQFDSRVGTAIERFTNELTAMSAMQSSLYKAAERLGQAVERARSLAVPSPPPNSLLGRLRE